MVAAFKERGKFVADGLNRIPGVKCLSPAGAFYAFPDCREAIRNLHKAGRIASPTDLALCDYLLTQEKGVAAVPGSAFGAEGYLRISFATSMENIKKRSAPGRPWRCSASRHERRSSNLGNVSR